MTGLELDPWQELVLAGSLGEKADGKWAAREVGCVVPRQNGKNSILEARELAGLFLLGERLIIHSAHQFDTSVEQFRRLLFLVEEDSQFKKRVAKISRAHGAEGITLKNGQRITFRTRTRGGGRGFSCDCLVLDEAMILPESAHGALMPTLSARPNPQIWYTGSAVDQEIHEDGIVFARVRERGTAGNDPGLAYFEWSVEGDSPEEVGKERATDPEAWAEANPGLGIRISAEHVALEQRSMDPRTFAVERLGVGDWPQTDGFAKKKIHPEAWAGLTDSDSRPKDPVCFCLDVSPDRAWASIGVAGRRSDGLAHLETIDRGSLRGTGWVVERCVELTKKHRNVGLALAANGPVASLLPDLQKAGLTLQTEPGRGTIILVNSAEEAQACGGLYDAVDQSLLRHLGTPDLQAAIAGAVARPLGDRWAWNRKDSTIDISPLVAVTLALWGLQTFAKPGKAQVVDLNELVNEMREDGEDLSDPFA
jgi:hypothetical protein